MVAWLCLPIACVWVARQERHILRSGRALSPEQLEDARRLGIARPERIRVRVVECLTVGYGRAPMEREAEEMALRMMEG